MTIRQKPRRCRDGVVLTGVLAGVLAGVLMLASGGVAAAGEVDVVAATARPGTDGSWTISATLRHADEGWSHYADRWEVIGPAGELLGTRTLLHPHVEEQPFTRSLSGVRIPDGVDTVTIRAHDSRHGTGGAEYVLELTR